MNKQINNFLDNISVEKNTSKLTVAPIMCGAGKSSYISKKIADICRNGGKQGLLIVTDATNRMYGYESPHDEEIKKILMENPGRVTIMTRDNLGDALRNQARKPILIISTQRYFRLTRNEIQTLLKWKNGTRDLIIFDEKPYLTEQIRINIKHFTDIDAVLQMGIDDTANQTDKRWIINQWQMLKMRVQSIMDEYENLGDKHFALFHVDQSKTLTIDDQRFWKIIRENKRNLISRDPDIILTLQAIHQMIADGAIFTCRKKASGEYEKAFYVLLDHYSKLINLDANVIVLDGTGDISPEYDTDYTRILPCSQFKRNLPNLTINIVDTPTSKRNLCTSNSKRRIDALLRYLTETIDGNNAALFTYRDIEQRFEKDFTSVCHFGNIKGRNDLRNFSSIVQVGLNRFPPIYYYLAYVSLNPNELDLLKKLNTNESMSYLTKMLNDPKSNSEIMNRCILADIEQNLFRGTIRNPRSTEKMVFTILFNVTEYSELVELIKARYSKLGATVNVLPTPKTLQLEKITNRKTKDESISQRVVTWLSTQTPGEFFKVTDMLNALNINYRQFDKARTNNQSLKRIFTEMQSGKKGYYRVA